MDLGLRRNHHIKEYISATFAAEDEDLLRARLNSKQKGLPDIHIPALVGKILATLIKLHRPKRVLEIGTLGGYSTLWMAKALPAEAYLLSLELFPEHIAIAQENLQTSFILPLVEFQQGHAKELLKAMITHNTPPFDFVFLDADKKNYPTYLELILQLLAPGGILASDNLIPREGHINQAAPDDKDAQGIYTFNRLIATHPRLESILLPTIVGHHGRLDALGLSLYR